MPKEMIISSDEAQTLELRIADCCFVCIHRDESPNSYANCSIVDCYVGRHQICNEFEREEENE